MIRKIFRTSIIIFLLSNSKIFNLDQLQLKKEIVFFNQFIKNGDLVFDVGANIGVKTEIFLSCGAKVVCFEPLQKALIELCSKFKNNTNVTIIPNGLSYEPGFIDFYECCVLSTCSKDWTTSGRFQGANWKNPIKIEVTTLDKMINIYGMPKFCKIDVENFEYEVLKGLSFIIPALSFEFTYERKANAKKCLDYLTKLGYRKFNFSAGESLNFIFDKWLSAEILLEKIYSENKFGEDLWGDIYAKFE